MRCCVLAVIASACLGCSADMETPALSGDTMDTSATDGGTAEADVASVLDTSTLLDTQAPPTDDTTTLEDSTAPLDTATMDAADLTDIIDTDDVEEPEDAGPIDTYDGPPIVGLAEAKALYGTYCALCHGPNGEGYQADGANQLNNQSWLATVTDEHIEAAIALGRPTTTMSSWYQGYAGPLTGVETQALVQLIRGWQTAPNVILNETPIVGSASRGAGIWEFHCASCHGAEGTGGPYSALANPVLLSTASDAFLRYAIAKGRPGTPMPGYETVLTAQGIDDLVALLRSWSGDIQPPPTELPNDEAPAILNPEAENAVLGDQYYAPMDTVYAEYAAEKRLTIIDARPPGDYLDEHIAGAISVPFYAVEEHLDRLDPSVPVVAYCACPHAESGTAADALIALGFPVVHVLDEGFFAWRDSGLPTSNGPNP